MNVYDEYVRNASGPTGDAGEAITNGTENVNPATEQGKDAE